MQTIPVTTFGRYVIVSKRLDEAEWQFHHPTDADPALHQIWFNDPVDACQHVEHLREMELFDWEVTEGLDDDGYPMVQTVYEVFELAPLGAVPHHAATVDSTFCCACGEAWPCPTVR